MVICLERGADLHMAQWIPLSLTVSCFSKIQIDFTFLVPVHPGSPRQRAVKRWCVCVPIINLCAEDYLLHSKIRPIANTTVVFMYLPVSIIYFSFKTRSKASTSSRSADFTECNQSFTNIWLSTVTQHKTYKQHTLLSTWIRTRGTTISEEPQLSHTSFTTVVYHVLTSTSTF